MTRKISKPGLALLAILFVGVGSAFVLLRLGEDFATSAPRAHPLPEGTSQARAEPSSKSISSGQTNGAHDAQAQAPILESPEPKHPQAHRNPQAQDEYFRPNGLKSDEDAELPIRRFDENGNEYLTIRQTPKGRERTERTFSASGSLLRVETFLNDRRIKLQEF